jgi:hypothetical protein
LTVNYEAPDISFPNGALTVLLNGNPIGLNNVALPASLSSLAGSNMGYFGFTASTGGATGTGPEIYVGSLVAGPPRARAGDRAPDRHRRHRIAPATPSTSQRFSRLTFPVDHIIALHQPCAPGLSSCV